jgi:hypothetical protein
MSFLFPKAQTEVCATQLDQQLAAPVEQALACSSTFSAASEACATLVAGRSPTDRWLGQWRRDGGRFFQ